MTQVGSILICDLDGTLIDTTDLNELREQRRWKECSGRFHVTNCFPRIQEILIELKTAGVGIGIVTSSVSYYAEAILDHHSIPYDALVAFHDAPSKPSPKPIFKCLSRFSFQPERIVAIGDAIHDAAAYKAAGVLSLGAGWSHKLVRQKVAWDAILETPDQLLDYFG